jgi:predicted ribosomally synthesized peptide with nif11-like leader
MAGNIIKAHQAVQEDPALRDRLRSADSPADKRQVLADAGHSGFTPDQADVLRKKQSGSELSDADLQTIAGGGTTTVVSSIVHSVVEVTEEACEDIAEAAA